LRFTTSSERMSFSIQDFAGNPLNRSVGDRKNESFLLSKLKCEQTEVIVVKTDGRAKTVLCKIDNDIYQLVKYSPNTVLSMCSCNTMEDLLVHYVVVLLGHDDTSARWTVCIDFSNDSKIKLPEDQALVFESGRSILSKLQHSELAIAGQALAISGWHDVNIFCGKSGLPTIPIECGMKRRVFDAAQQLSSTRLTKLYPRIDPVAIVAVISPDKKHILLGNMKSYPPHFFSCLSGFVEPCESVEEAVRREVWEESGVSIDVERVTILGTQPWPIGRGGGCEIMIGCIAFAGDTTITIHDSAVNEVRWFTIEEAQSMVELASVRGMLNSKASSNPFIPGSYAIAFHLVKASLEMMSNSDSKSGEKSIDGGGSGESKDIITRRMPKSIPLYWILPLAMYSWSLASVR
jgi:NADH pyrophosphatase NudC (nudix superfamily)